MVKRVLRALLLWTRDVKPAFTSLCIFFHRLHTKQAFIKERLLDRGHGDLRPLFDAGPPLLQGGREWSVISEAMDWYVERRGILDEHWPLQGDDGNEQEAEAAEEEGDEGENLYDDSVHRKRLDKSLHDPYWISGTIVIHYLLRWVWHLQNWCKSCPCHSAALLRSLNKELSDIRCPHKGCRAVCLATGAVNEFIRNLNLLTEAFLSRDLLPALLHEQRSFLLDAFRSAKNFMIAEFRIRTLCYSVLPLRSFGMAHEDDCKAVAALVDGLIQFERLEQSGNLGQVHPRTLELYARGGRLRTLVLDIVNHRKTFAECPELLHYRVAPHFVKTNEASIEEKHARISGMIRSAPHHSAGLVSMEVRKHEILQNNVRDPDFSRIMIEKLHEFINPKACIDGLEMGLHPAVQEFAALNDGSWNALTVKAATDIVFRGDLQTGFQHLEL